MGAIDKLTDKQKLFMEEYVRTHNATASARVAGYSSPESNGNRMKNHPGIVAAVEEFHENKLQRRRLERERSVFSRENLVEETYELVQQAKHNNDLPNAYRGIEIIMKALWYGRVAPEKHEGSADGGLTDSKSYDFAGMTDEDLYRLVRSEDKGK